MLLALLEAPSIIALLLWMIVPLAMTIYFSFIHIAAEPGHKRLCRNRKLPISRGG